MTRPRFPTDGPLPFRRSPYTAVVGRPEVEARQVLADSGLETHVIAHHYHARVPYGGVISSQPPALMSVRSGRRVELVISSGPSQTPVPKVVGLRLAEAQYRLEQAGFALGQTLGQHSDKAVDTVLSQTPAAGEKLPREAEVTLTVSGGPDFGKLTDPEGHTVLLRRLRLVVPGGADSQQVRVALEHAGESETIYDRIHQPGDELLVDFTAAPGDRLKISLEDRVIERIRL